MCSGSDEGRRYSTTVGCISCIVFRGSSSRHSGCWNKKSRPIRFTKHSQSFSFLSSFQYLTALLLLTLTCFPLVTTATNNASIQEAPSPSQQSHHSNSSSSRNNNNNNTDVASPQKGLSSLFDLFDLQQTPMATLRTRNITVGYLDALMDEFGSNGSIGKEQLSEMIEKIMKTHRQRDEKDPNHQIKAGVHGDLSALCTSRSFIHGIDSNRMNGTNLNYSVEEENGQSFPLSQLSCQVNKVRRKSLFTFKYFFRYRLKKGFNFLYGFVKHFYIFVYLIRYLNSNK